MLRAPRMRREPTGRRGFELFAISPNRSQQRAAKRDSSSDATARQKVRPAPRHGRPTSCSVDEARAKYIGKRMTCARERRAANIEVLLQVLIRTKLAFSACSGRPRGEQVMPLVVKLSMIVVPTVNTCRQRDSKRSMRTPRMRREPTDRRGFTLFIFLQIARERASDDSRAY